MKSRSGLNGEMEFLGMGSQWPVRRCANLVMEYESHRNRN